METIELQTPVDTLRSSAPPEKKEAGDLDVIDLLIAIAKHRAMVLKIVVSAAIVAIIVSLLLPNRYSATTRILPPQQTQSTASMVLSQLAGSAGSSLAALASKDLGLKSPNDIYIGILKSRTVADELIAQFDLRKVYNTKRMSSARKELQNNSQITTGKEGLIAISVEDEDPKRAAAIANAYVSEMRKLTQTLAVTEASQRRLFFEEQLQRAKTDLAGAEVELKDTQQRTGMIQLDSQSKAVIEAVGMLRGQIAAKEVQLQAMRSFATDQNPDYLIVQQEIAGLHTQLEKLQHQSSGGEGDPFLATAKVPSVALDYVRRLREVKYREAVFELLAKQFEAAKIDEAKQAALIQVLDPAIEPDRKSSPRRALMVILITLIAFFGGVCVALVREAVQRLKENPQRSVKLQKLSEALLGRRPLQFRQEESS